MKPTGQPTLLVMFAFGLLQSAFNLTYPVAVVRADSNSPSGDVDRPGAGGSVTTDSQAYRPAPGSMSTKPNIVFILVDDLGWKDLACCGSEFYETPNLDRLSGEGMRFTDAYASCPVCSPTRASILTGKYPATVGVTDWIDSGGGTHPARGRLVDVSYLRELPTSEHTVAEELRRNGYATWHVGKWHLGGDGSLPEDHGFDVNIGGCHVGSPGTGGYFSPWTIPATSWH